MNGIEIDNVSIREFITDVLANVYNPYDDFEFWDGENNFYPDIGESCVGLIFINDSSAEGLRNNCIIEFNYGDTINGLTYDTSGQGNIGIHIGDFEVKKTNKKTPVRRDSTMNLAETNDTERAI